MMEKIEKNNKRLTEIEEKVRNLTISDSVASTTRLEINNSSSPVDSEEPSAQPPLQRTQTKDSFVSCDFYELD